jgi:IS30 family transposase
LSITHDDGSKNTKFKKVEAKLKINYVFYEIYHILDIGAEEQMKSLIKRYYP